MINEKGSSPVIGVILMVSITVILAAIIAAFVFGMSGNISRTSTNPGINKTVEVTYFYGQGCGHCEKVNIYLDEMKEKYPNLIIKKYEIYHNADNYDYYVKINRAAGFTLYGVPEIVINDIILVGGTSIEENLESQIIILNKE